MAGNNDAFTVLMLHCDGTNASTTVTNDGLGGTTAVTANAGCALDTGSKEFGSASLNFDGVNDSLSFNGSGSDWSWAGDFSIDLWINCTSAASDGGSRRLFSFGSGATNLQAYFDLSGTLSITTGAGTVLITGTTANADSTWRHIAITRSGTSLKLFVAGSQQGSTATDSVSWVGSNPSYFGRNQSSDVAHYSGHLDEIRVSKGIARWTSNFTPPTAAYPFDYSLTAAAGAFTFTGVAVAMQIARRVAAGAGAFVLTGKPALFAKGYHMVASAGSFTLTGMAVILNRFVMPSKLLRKVKFVLQKLRTTDPTLTE